MARGTPSTNQPSTPQEWVDAYLNHVRKHRAKGTYAAVRDQIPKLMTFLQPADWDDVEEPDIFSFLARERDTKTGRPATSSVSRDLSLLRGFFKFIHNRGGLTNLPMPDAKRDFELPKSETTALKQPLPHHAWLDIWRGPHTNTDDRVWLGLGYFSGMRCEEMAMLPPSGVVPRSDGGHEAGTLNFTRKLDKKERGISTAAIVNILSHPGFGLGEVGTTAVEWLELLEWTAAHRHDQDLLVASALGQDSGRDAKRIYDRLRRIVAKFPWAGEIALSPHILRHSAATNLALCGVPDDAIMRQLSHSDTSMTARYIKTAHRELTKWYDDQKRQRGLG